MKNAEDEATLIGRITRPHGIRGEVRVLPITIDIKRFLSLKEVFLSAKGSGKLSQKRKVSKARINKNMVILKLAECESCEEAEELRDFEIKVAAQDRVELSDDSYFWDDLLGMEVKSDEGRVVGFVREIFPTGANDVLVVQDNDKELLLPFTGDVILNVDLLKKQMLVHIIDGLI